MKIEGTKIHGKQENKATKTRVQKWDRKKHRSSFKMDERSRGMFQRRPTRRMLHDVIILVHFSIFFNEKKTTTTNTHFYNIFVPRKGTLTLTLGMGMGGEGGGPFRTPNPQQSF